jgi:hypothetical protein
MENIQDLYQYSGLETGALEGFETAGKLYDLVKAMSATHQTGRELTGVDTAGAALKVESLDPALKIITSQDRHIKLWKMMPKQKAYNTVEEFNQLVDYGLDIGIFNQEGETPQATDSIYRRNAVLVKYTGVTGEVTHPFELVKLGSGVGNALSQEVMNKTQFLLRSLNKSIPTAKSSLVSNEFDGIFAQHQGADSLASYLGGNKVIDARGSVLTDTHVEAAASNVVNDGFGYVTDIISNPQVFSNYVKYYHDRKYIIPGMSGSVQGATMGQSVNKIQTQFGLIDVQDDIFFDYKKARKYDDGATSSKAPAVPVISSTGVAIVSGDVQTKFGDGDGCYFWAVSAKNRFGESALLRLNPGAVQAVATTESVNLLFTAGAGAYATESFVIYRTEVDAANEDKFYPIFSVSVAEHTAGYDGGSAGIVRDRNRFIANTHSAIMLQNSEDVWAIKQLAPIMRMDLARTSPATRFMILAYLTPVLFAQQKISRIINIGAKMS